MHTRLPVALAAALLGAAGCSGDQEKTTQETRHETSQEWNRSGSEWPHASNNYFAPDGGESKETAQVEATDVMPPAESSDLAPDTGASPVTNTEQASSSRDESSTKSEPASPPTGDSTASSKDEKKSFTAASDEGKKNEAENKTASASGPGAADEQASASKPIEEDAQQERSSRTGAYLAAGIGAAALLAFAGSRRRRNER